MRFNLDRQSTFIRRIMPMGFINQMNTNQKPKQKTRTAEKCFNVKGFVPCSKGFYFGQL